MLHRLLALTFTILLNAGACGQSLVAVPPLKAHLTDAAGMLEPAQRATLEQVLAEYEARTGSQIGVLLIDSTAPEVIEQFGIRAADAWKVGRKGVDDGVLLIVARNNPRELRRLRIEAGRGVQGSLTDAQSKRILQDVIAPHFRQNDYYGGLVAGVAAIAELLDREHFPARAAKSGAAFAWDSAGSFWPFLLFAGLIVIAIFRSGGRHGPGLHRGGWGPGSGVILGSILGSQIGRGRFDGRGSGGGFSGGGGGFDGGGASGDW